MPSKGFVFVAGALVNGFVENVEMLIIGRILLNDIGTKDWRIALGLAGVPSVVITLGSLVFLDTPNSFINRGYTKEAKAMLKKIHGTNNIEEEFQDLVEAFEAS
ncbi:hypothetical protein Ancab_029141 [Ancistrocladus abbreviatus]